ncbi:MAG TPA: hypothetical protein PLV92_03280 [Pirellulaceae bacterium]|nr:hypothetical protein [Pirellulaceae bacterium]
MASQSLGSLYVTLNAEATGFVKGLSKAAGMADKFTKEVKKLAADVSQTATAFSALGVAAMAMSAQVDARSAASMRRLTKSTQLLATQVADVLAPAIRSLSDLFRQAANAIASLDPATKKQISSWAVMAVQIGAAAKVIGVVFGLINGLAGAFEYMFAIVGAIGVGPLVAVVAALAALAVWVAVVHKAWRENFEGIQQVVGKVAQAFADAWQGATNFVAGLFAGFVDKLAGMVKTGLGLMAAAAEAMGNPMAAGAIRIAMSTVDNVAKDFKSGAMAKRFVVAAAELGKKAATSLIEEFKIIAKELGLDKALDAMLAKWNASKNSGAARQPGLGPSQQFSWYAKSFGDEKFMDALKMKGPRHLAGTTSPDQFEARRNYEAMWQKEQEAARATGEAIAATGQQFIGKLGDLGGIINDTINAAQAGGPWAALAAALAGIAMQTQGFADLLSQATGGLAMLAQAFGPAMKNLLGAVGNILAPALQAVGAAFTAITPILNVVAQVVNAVAPILVIVGYFFQMLAPLLNLLVVVLQPVIAVLEFVMRALFEIARIVMTVVGAIATGVVAIWNGIIEAIATIVDTVISVLTVGAVQHGGEFIRSAKAATTSFDQGLFAMTTTSYDAAMAAAQKAAADQRAAGAADKATDSIQKFSESFLNVPSGYKVSSARFSATNPIDGGGDGGGPVFVINGLTVMAKSPHDFVKVMAAAAAGETFKSTGDAGGNAMRNLR